MDLSAIVYSWLQNYCADYVSRFPTVQHPRPHMMSLLFSCKDGQLRGLVEHFKRRWTCRGFRFMALLMAKILHQLRLVVYPIIYRVSYIPGGARFQPSTVVQIFFWIFLLMGTRDVSWFVDVVSRYLEDPEIPKARWPERWALRACTDHIPGGNSSLAGMSWY